jgi:cytochrome c oxidase subunit II
MEGIIDLHHDIMFFLIVISLFVSWMLIVIITNFNSKNTKYFISGSPGEFASYNNLPSKVIHNTRLEIVWTIIPCIILVMIAVPSFTLLYKMDEVSDIGMTLKVTGNQWYWHYDYTSPLGKIGFDQRMKLHYEGRDYDYLPRLLWTTEPYVILPSQTNIRLLVTSLDVLHSWALPAAGIKIDACPGRLNEVFLRVDRPAHLFGQCSEICGINHAFMPIHVFVIYPEDYEDFMIPRTYIFLNSDNELSFRELFTRFYWGIQLPRQQELYA